MVKYNDSGGWNAVDPSIFWGELAPTEHIVQVYENDDIFMHLLESFVTEGLKSGDCVCIIATEAHLASLNFRLTAAGIAIETVTMEGLYIPLDAKKVLSEFIVNGWPNTRLFHQSISKIIKRAKESDRRLRVFGEMVAVLWADGLKGATVHLENLWSRLCETEAFCLLCAYPKTGFTQDATSSLESICCAHSKMISGEHNPKSKILYRPTLRTAG